MRERDDQECVHAHVPQDLLLLRQRQNLLRHPVGRHDRERVGMERDHRRRLPELSRPPNHPADDLLVADMQPVEVADRGHASAGQVRLS